MEHKCMPICFWCTKETGKPVMLPEVNGKKPPAKAILNYEPCDSCAEMFGKGIHVIGVVEKAPVETMPPITSNDEVKVYPTGSFFVASVEWVEQMLKANSNQEMLEEVIKHKVLMMPDEIVQKIIEEAKDVPAVEVPVMEDNVNESNGN